jgi:hypothetical protein
MTYIYNSSKDKEYTLSTTYWTRKYTETIGPQQRRAFTLTSPDLITIVEKGRKTINLSYKQLTPDEMRSGIIPHHHGSIVKEIDSNFPYEWKIVEPIEDTLTYINGTKKSVAYFSSSKNNMIHEIDMATLKSFIPHLIGGRICGMFNYVLVARGHRKMIVTLNLMNVCKFDDIALCESSDDEATAILDT